MRFPYTLLLYLALPVIFLRLLIRSINASDYRQRWLERLGFFPVQRSSSAATIWLHTVSVGETLAAKPLVNMLLTRHPSCTIIMTTMTPTGSAQVQRLFKPELEQGRVLHSYIPYDLPDAVARFISRARPAVAIFMETEVWPNILAVCDKKNIHTLLINARLSEKSLKGYQRFSSFSATTFSRFTHIMAQSTVDSERIQRLSSSEVTVSGNIKSEVVIDDLLRKKAEALKNVWSLNNTKKIIIAVSTHAGEDEIILSAYKVWQEQFPQSLLVLVPRHPERFNSVLALCRAENFVTVTRSSGASITEGTQVIVGDTMGEMMVMCGASDVAIVCGSFVEHGGHNMLEPAAWGLPVVTGSYIVNFSQVVNDMQSANALCVVDEDGLIGCVEKILRDSAYAQQLGNNAKYYVEKNRGALEKTINLIEKYTSL